MDYTNVFRLANIAVGVLMMLGAIGQFVGITVSSGILGVYVVLFSLVTLGLEFTPQIPPYLPKYASFLFSFLGRGVFYVFVGSIILEGHVFRHIVGAIIALIGVAYIGLEFVPSIEPPVTMREEEAAWGAEQI